MNVAAAIKARDATALPSKRDEDWRWTDLRGLIREIPPPMHWEPGYGAVDTTKESPFAATRRVTFLNGSANGLGLRDQQPLVFDKYDPVVALDVYAFGDVSDSSGIKIVVPAGHAATLVECHLGERGSYLAHFHLNIVVEAGATLERIVLADDDSEGVRVVEADVSLAAGAKFGQTAITSGGRRQRLQTTVHHPGGHAELRLDGVYLLADKRHADLTTIVTHEGVDGVTTQLTKGVVRDQARGVFQGRIVVAEGADKTDARMGHHALILSDRAEVDAKPELEIYADDVACAHGNTVGALDQDALFYARQRGMPEEVARALLTEAFIGEVIDRIEHQPAREVVRDWAAERLRG